MPKHRVVFIRAARHKLTLIFSSKAYADVDDLRRKTQKSKIADVLRDAVRFYKWYVEKREQGYQLALCKKGESTKVVDLKL